MFLVLIMIFSKIWRSINKIYLKGKNLIKWHWMEIEAPKPKHPSSYYEMFNGDKWITLQHAKLKKNLQDYSHIQDWSFVWYNIIHNILSLNLLERFTEDKQGIPVMTIYIYFKLCVCGRLVYWHTFLCFCSTTREETPERPRSGRRGRPPKANKNR